MRRRLETLCVAVAVLAVAVATASVVLGCGSATDGASPAAAASVSAAAATVTPETVVAFVDEAVAFARDHGKEAALAAYNDAGGEFRRGAFYVFAYDMTGKNLAHIDPALVGRDLIDLKDPEGTPIIRRFVEIAQKGGGWFTYVWPNPVHGDRPEPKLAYITRVGSDWLLGAGMYLPVVGQALTSPSPAAGSPVLTEAQIVDFVERAADYVRTNGKEKALAAFNDPQGGFREGDLYVFAKDFDGNELANGGNPKLVGTNFRESDDADYRRVFDMLYAAAVNGAGWTAYTWPNPETGEDQVKQSYVVKAGEDWFLGAGMYTGPATQVTAERVVAFVEAAAAYVKANGKEKALEVFSDPRGEFRDGELYVFAEDFKGNELASGGQPELVGQNILDVQDPDGVYLVKELIATARDKGRGWVSYTWENPETGRQQAKRAYVIKAGDDWYVGSGMYVR